MSPKRFTWPVFPLGSSVLALGVVALVAMAVVATRGTTIVPGQPVWAFTEAHRAHFLDRQPGYAGQYRVELVSVRAMTLRLVGLFGSPDARNLLPDVTEMEINQVGRFFRPPVNDVGFLPLNDFLSTAGERTIASPSEAGLKGWRARCTGDGRIYSHDGAAWRDAPGKVADHYRERVLASRYAALSKRGVIFGVPMDIHPVTLTYRKDLFDEAGVDMESPATWGQMREAMRAFQRYWRAKGVTRYAMDLPRNSSDVLQVMLLQRGINLLDDDMASHLSDAKTVETLAFYATLVAGREPVGATAGGGFGMAAKDISDGTLCSYITPDWRVKDLRTFSGEKLAGKLRMRALPVFEAGDSPTATWGGTMLAVPRNVADPARALALLEHLALKPETMLARWRDLGILPPAPELWDRDVFRAPDPMFAGQSISRLYLELAPRVPARIVTPATAVAGGSLAYALSLTNDALDAHGEAGLAQEARNNLRRVEADLLGRIKHGQLDQE